MKVLVVGGTKFIGRHVVQKLLRDGHDVTLLNRGISSPHLFRECSLLKADRQSEQLGEVKGLRQTWDAVVDLSAYLPTDVSRLLEILKGQAGRYIFCSTISAYAALKQDGPKALLSEDSPLLDCTLEEARDSSMVAYGEKKAECERLIQKQSANGTPFVVIRPSVVFGSFDDTDRFAYWISRASSEQKFVLPDDGLTTIQLTYAPDLAAAFAASLTSSRALGNHYNIAESDPRSLRVKIQLIGQHLKREPLKHAVAVTSEALLKAGIQPWQDFPLWIPQQNLSIDTFRSRRDLDFIATSTEQALSEAADAFLSEKREPKAGISRMRELELLAKIC